MAWITRVCTLLLLFATVLPGSLSIGQTLGKYLPLGLFASETESPRESGLHELPQPYEVPLPEECVVPGADTRSYNQGQCSRKPCTTSYGPCAQSLQCCYEIGQISHVEFLCSKSSTRLKADVILTCSCQVCDKLHTHIRGRVLSSFGHKPVVLVAVMIGTEVATFTDDNGYFSFELSTSNGDIAILFQETKHRLLETTVNIRHSKSPEINVIMEYIESSQTIDKLHAGLDVRLGNKEMGDGLEASMVIPPHSFSDTNTHSVYEGSGKLLYSLYDAQKRPDFTSEALNHMVYADSKGVHFSIQSYVICSMEVVGESGHSLSLRPSTLLPLSVRMKFDRAIDGTDLHKLHLFAYSKQKSKWHDYGHVGISSTQKQENGYGTIVTVKHTLRDVNTLWAIGFPVRVTCFIKVLVTHEMTRKELSDMTLSLTQSDTSLARPTFYQYTSSTSPGVGVCLKAVCSVGGNIKVLASESSRIAAIPPSVDFGMVMGDKKRIMFYDGIGTESPYFKSESDCQAATKPYFEFTSNSSTAAVPQQPSLMPLVQQGDKVPKPQLNQREYCFVKVSVYDCAPYTEIKVLSYSSYNHEQLLSMKTAVAMGSGENLNTCQSSEVVGSRAACVEFTCGSDVHVTVQSLNHYDTDKSGSRSSTGHSIDCRYWSSNRNIHSDHHPSENMKSFHLSDSHSLATSSGVYRSSSASLAQLQCMSGRQDAPGTIIDIETGVAVTFTCLL